MVVAASDEDSLQEVERFGLSAVEAAAPRLVGIFEKDGDHQIYCLPAGKSCAWRIAKQGIGTYYTAATQHYGDAAVPTAGWGVGSLGRMPMPTVEAAHA